MVNTPFVVLFSGFACVTACTVLYCNSFSTQTPEKSSIALADPCQDGFDQDSVFKVNYQYSTVLHHVLVVCCLLYT